MNPLKIVGKGCRVDHDLIGRFAQRIYEKLELVRRFFELLGDCPELLCGLL